MIIAEPRGVVSVEVALAFPALILVVGSVISVCRLAQTNIRLDSVTSIALHQCVLRPEGVDPETVAGVYKPPSMSRIQRLCKQSHGDIR